MTEPASTNQFRDALSRWNQSRSQAATQPTSTDSGSSFFGRIGESLNATANDVYQRLPISRQDLIQETQEPEWFTLSRTERLILFICFLLGAAVCFTLCVFLFPVLAIKPRKFGLLWSFGSLLFVTAFGIFMGPIAYMKHLTSRERLPFTIFFFTTCFMTIYFAAFMKSSILTIPCAILQLIAVLYYAISYFPFGGTTLRMLSSMGLSTARGVLRI
ncbi:Sft2p NDAI_0E04580 [Naumovozyma dairenensis CBS 421]|uniref:Protein transport protein SFT2 n=1 Tax=Naumovozyma dairenensis (strain ATCC 10597 / BCRC 20456 / CBS 421 / NBRC 0211 / NRRL Y-12639) TaxID=1071378 RepID=G0WC05_NAUDC|nr:hypothetical protein NDAI_0E04580 [Naumovozyma dairenensis CBS 421]CCD25275.1 hypothetical protein NDAI_0E04580 [Naumovozyma dairenensis CBS 421]